MGKRTKKEGNYLDYVPHWRVAWEEGEDGAAHLLFPRFGNFGPGRLLQRLLGLKDLHLDLDEYGSWIWKQCDGRQSVYEIGRKFYEINPGEEKPYERIALFIQQLEHSHALEVRPHEPHE